MSEPTACTLTPADPDRPSSPSRCEHCDLLVGLEGLHVREVVRDRDGLTVTVESPPAPMGCSTCGVLDHGHGRVSVDLVDLPCFGKPVQARWVKRRWPCPEPACPVGTFVEQDQRVARPRGLLTVRACWWAIEQVRREHASVLGIARQLGPSWKTVWRSIEPILADERRRATPCRTASQRAAGQTHRAAATGVHRRMIRIDPDNRVFARGRCTVRG